MSKQHGKQQKAGVLLLAPSLCIGGAELVISNLARNLDPKRFDVRVGYIKKMGEVGDDLIRDGFQVDKIGAPAVPGGGALSFLTLRRYVNKEKIRIIHSHGVEALVDASLCKWSRPSVQIIHTYHFGNYPQVRFGNRRLENLFWRTPDRLIAVGRRQREAIRKTYGIPSDRIETVYNGVIDSEQAIDQNLLAPYLDSGKVLIGSISTMIEQKGIPDLLDVAAALRKRTDKALFLVAGDGRLLEAMKAKRDAMGLQDTVHFFGWVVNAASTILPALDIFLQTSHWEAMSMVVLEAMAARKAIVTTDVGDNSYMIETGRTGIVVQPGDVEGMVDALAGLCEDCSTRERLGREAVVDYRNRFTVQSMVERYEQLYEEMLLD